MKAENVTKKVEEKVIYPHSYLEGKRREGDKDRT